MGEGLSQAVREATRVLRLSEKKTGDTYCDLNGERNRAEEFTFAVLRNPHLFEDANRFTAPADAWGDGGAAAGPLLAMLAAAFRNALIRPRSSSACARRLQRRFARRSGARAISVIVRWWWC